MITGNRLGQYRIFHFFTLKNSCDTSDNISWYRCIQSIIFVAFSRIGAEFMQLLVSSVTTSINTRDPQKPPMPIPSQSLHLFHKRCYMFQVIYFSGLNGLCLAVNHTEFFSSPRKGSCYHSALMPSWDAWSF